MPLTGQAGVEVGEALIDQGGQVLAGPADPGRLLASRRAWRAGWRDHWSRTSPLAMLYVVFEGMVRELLGPGRILGNHVVLDLGHGVHAALAHLRRGSVLVRPGDRVAAGQQLAACGNSGNTNEPHLHFQVMDHPSVLLAAGLPVRFAHYQVAGADRAGGPHNLQPFTAPGCAAPSRRGTAGGSRGRRR